MKIEKLFDLHHDDTIRFEDLQMNKNIAYVVTHVAVYRIQI
jgi:hypothetical protein